MWRDFQRGFSYVFRGVGAFYKDASLWKYSLLPLLILIALYTSLLVGAVWMCCHQFSWLKLLLAIALLVAAVLSVYAIYELCGALFFDRMLEEFEKKQFAFHPEKHPLRFNIVFALQSCHYCCNTLLLTVVMSFAGLFLPIAGVVIAALVLGRRFATAYLAASGFNYLKNLNDTKHIFKKHRSVMLGYGVCCYLLFLLPLAPLFAVPGILLGGSLLWHGEILNGTTGGDVSEFPAR